ncbi:MAG: isoleucine--tRNA ligase [Bacteroidetes bacterium]|nr:isoleucine--tRNA ligase [Bacteroidota bacterium]
MQAKQEQKLYPEYSHSDFPGFEKEISKYWKEHNIFQKTIENRANSKEFIFYEGPPSANGMPGIHHVMSRTIKDLFCRFKTLEGYKVNRKAGWDTHGLPIELQVEKKLGITKDDIGKKISIEDYNAECRKDVMKFKGIWDDLTEKIGYWVDLQNPYITYENNYIETVWFLLKEIYKKGYLYKGYTIQPYSPAAGTGLSSHELNQPGTYRDVKDTSAVAQFKVKIDELNKLGNTDGEVFFLAWTTTPWTLPSNTALAVGKSIKYVLVKTFNQYTFKPINVILAKDLVSKFFKNEDSDLEFENYKPGDKKIPFKILNEYTGKNLIGIRYEQLLQYTLPAENPEKAFVVIEGDFVSTEDGTGIVHIAPTFGADDARVAKKAGVPAMLVKNADGKLVPLVDLQGKFIEVMGEFAGKYVKNEFYKNAPEKSVDVEIAVKLKEENKAFKVEKYEHSYPHCWRTDKPVLYYPLESWFIKTTAIKDKLISLNKTINWKPQSTGEGRFGNWLQNLVDWNLSRSRYWGTPLPIWRTEDGKEEICIGSIEELKFEIQKAIKAGLSNSSVLDSGHGLDLHRPYVDNIVLVSPSGKPMKRETDLIDVWFDSGAMPYAQWGLDKLIDNKNSKLNLNGIFPADFIAEGVDQTRGWFFTLHAIGVMLFDSVAFKNVVANGLVLDKNGNKMSKRLSNTVDPFITVEKYGADATRWYLIGNAAPWDNLKFDIEGLAETQRKFFGTLYNTYSFFALYANLDKFVYIKDDEIPYNELSELDKWIISELNKLIDDVKKYFDNYEPHLATRAIQDFVNDNLSNWHVRLSRRRFWKSESGADKKSAFETLYKCLETVSVLMSPVAPFFADWLYKNLNGVFQKNQSQISVHLCNFPQSEKSKIDKKLMESMALAQKICSMILAIRKKEKIKVRQPLQTILIPVINKNFETRIKSVKDLILTEVNVKEIKFLHDGENSIIVKTAKPDFKKLGPKVGSKMKELGVAISNFTAKEINKIEQEGSLNIDLGAFSFQLLLEDIEILTKDIEGWQVSVNDNLTVALDLKINDELYLEGLSREIINKIQNLRKDKGFKVDDRINVLISKQNEIDSAIFQYKDYICTEILAKSIISVNSVEGDIIDINGIEIKVAINKD